MYGFGSSFFQDTKFGIHGVGGVIPNFLFPFTKIPIDFVKENNRE